MKHRSMKQRLRTILLFLAAILTSPVGVLADDAKSYDARLESYANNVTLDGSTALLWLLTIALGAVCVGVLFINSKRTHLD
ncbi:MAG TPA: hypothetical protein VHD56_17025 [Tepidisphaeraceae bacterium]|nr:hypothetical protein [Tepidisphaeraceae bacterium]